MEAKPHQRIFTKQQIKDAFGLLKKDINGYISNFDLYQTDKASQEDRVLGTTKQILDFIKKQGGSLNPFSSLKNGKMNLKDFTLWIYGLTYKLEDLAAGKFKLSKYLQTSEVKKSSIHLKTAGLKKQNLHSIEFSFGFDKSHTLQTLLQLSKAFHGEIAFDAGETGPKLEKIHEGTYIHKHTNPFLLFKFNTQKQGQNAVKSLNILVNQLKAKIEELDDSKLVASSIEHKVKLFENNVYLLIQINNPFIEGLIQFAVDLVSTQSPDLTFNFKSKISSSHKDLLQDNFTYDQSKGQVLFQVKIDEVARKKIKEAIGQDSKQLKDYFGKIIDNFDEKLKPFNKILSLLLSQVNIVKETANLGDALTEVFQTSNEQANETLPKPSDFLKIVKGIQIQDKLQLLFGNKQISETLKQISERSNGLGEISINFHNFYFKLGYQVKVGDLFNKLF